MDIICATIQNKNVLKTLLDNQNYIADLNKANPNLVHSYSELMKAYNYQNCPIFLSPVGYLGQMYGASTNDTVVLKLKIPINDLKIQKYYDWTDFIYYLDCLGEFEESVSSKDYTFEKFTKDVFYNNKNLENKNAIYQLTTEVLKPEWLVNYFPLTEEFISKYIEFGGTNILEF